MLLEDLLFVQFSVEFAHCVDQAFVRSLACLKHLFTHCWIIPQCPIAKLFGIPPGVKSALTNPARDFKRLSWLTCDLPRLGDEISLMCTAEQLYKPPRLSIEKRDATPTP